MHFATAVLLLSLVVVHAGIFGGTTYTLDEQQCTHFEAALHAYHCNDQAKAIRILEYLQRDIRPSSTKYPFVVWNLALLYHDHGHYSRALQWSEIASKFEPTHFLGGFLLASLLYFKGKNDHYNSFMAFRSIKINKKTIITSGKNLEAIVDQNIALILYKLGAVAAADTQLDAAMDKAKNWASQLQHLKKMKQTQGIDFQVDTSPIVDFRLLTTDGCIDVDRIEPLHLKNKQKGKDISPLDSDDILAYYFESAPGSVNKPQQPLIPSPHQLSSHYDQHADYFSHKPNTNTRMNPSIVVTPPSVPHIPRPVLTRGVTAPGKFGAKLNVYPH